jgi:hypothetical protein
MKYYFIVNLFTNISVDSTFYKLIKLNKICFINLELYFLGIKGSCVIVWCSGKEMLLLSRR